MLSLTLEGRAVVYAPCELVDISTPVLVAHTLTAEIEWSVHINSGRVENMCTLGDMGYKSRCTCRSSSARRSPV